MAGTDFLLPGSVTLVTTELASCTDFLATLHRCNEAGQLSAAFTSRRSAQKLAALSGQERFILVQPFDCQGWRQAAQSASLWVETSLVVDQA
jgi:hypothetical protein